MKKYENAKAEVIVIDQIDVIRTSGDPYLYEPDDWVENA